MATTTLTRTDDHQTTIKGPHAPAFVRSASRLAILVEEKVQLEEILDRNTILWGFYNKLPVHQQTVYLARIAVLKEQIAGITRYERAIDLGYQPYSPPGDWYIGLLSPEDNGWEYGSRVSVHLTFNAPLPESALQALRKARRTHLFSGFAVGAPDMSLFTQTSSLFVDPVLIGYVPTKDVTSLRSTCDSLNTRIVGPGIIAEGLAGFLIAYWDLEKDREFMSKK